jgi:hypothetical protein
VSRPRRRADRYRAFSDAYGFEVLTWPGFQILDRIREPTLTTWLMQLVNDPRAGVEFQARVQQIRSGTFPRTGSMF